jgi:hypothetical protein
VTHSVPYLLEVGKRRGEMRRGEKAEFFLAITELIHH